MEDEKFTVGRVAQALGVNAQTLRYYEKEGLLSVRQNDSNRYRQYTQLDLRMALYARLYRSMGFSVDEARELLSGADTEAIRQALAQRTEEVHKQRIQLERLEKVLQIWQEGAKEAAAQSGHCWIEQISGSCYAVLKNGSRYQLSGGVDTDEVLIELQNQMPYTRQAFYIPQEMLGDCAGEYEDFYGMLADTEWVKEMNLEARLADYKLSYEGTAAVTVFRSQKEWTDRSSIEPLLCYLRENGYEPAGSMLGTILATEFTGDGHISYFKFYVPVRKKEDGFC